MRFAFFMVVVISFFFVASACFFDRLAERTETHITKKLFSDTVNCFTLDLE